MLAYQTPAVAFTPLLPGFAITNGGRPARLSFHCTAETASSEEGGGGEKQGELHCGGCLVEVEVWCFVLMSDAEKLKAHVVCRPVFVQCRCLLDTQKCLTSFWTCWLF